MHTLEKKRIITVALTGSWPTKKDNPNVPLSPEEIAADVYECWKAGAAVAHIHVRDETGAPSMDLDRFIKTVECIRAYKDCDISLNLTTSGGYFKDDEMRMLPFMTLLPEMASYDCGTINWQHTGVFENSPSFLEKLGLRLQEYNVKPEVEVFDSGMLYNALYYIKKGILKSPVHFQFVLGAAGGMAATVENLVFLKNLLPENCTWSALGIGKAHIPILLATIALGGNVRVGMEDNVMYAKGVPAQSNAQFVARAKRILEEAGYEAATPAEGRKILGLTRKV